MATIRSLRKSAVGKLTFNDVVIPFYDTYNGMYGRNFLIDESYFETIKDLSNQVSNLQEEVYHDVADRLHLVANYNNSYIDRVYLTTNFPGQIEVCFIINISVAKIRDIKLNLLINE